MQRRRHGCARRGPSRLSVGALAFILMLSVGFVAVRGQALTVLHSFGAPGTTPDGGQPNSTLAQASDGTLYGTSLESFTSQQLQTTGGVIFKTDRNGTVTVLHFFGDGSVLHDGTWPSGPLTIGNDGNIYGTTLQGGANGLGVVYKMTPQGAVTILHNFASGEATGPSSGAILEHGGVIQGQDGNFYGTAPAGGSTGHGAVFKITSQGAYSEVHAFSGSDGTAPDYGLVRDAQGNLFGTTEVGGSGNCGVVYEIDVSGNFSVIYNFPAASYTFTLSTAYQASGLGFSPHSALVIGPDGNLYGKASGQVYSQGAIYQITPQGQVTYLHVFGTAANDGAEFGTGYGSVDAMQNYSLGSPLIVGADGNIYGTTTSGGASGSGILFKITTAGVYTILHSFDGTDEGQSPNGIVQGSDEKFYGTASYGGGSAGGGTIFQFDPHGLGFTSPLHLTVGVGQPVAYQIAASPGPVTYQVSGLPAGWNFNSSNGVISGTPPVAGTIIITLSATQSPHTLLALLTIDVVTAPVISSLLNVVGSTSGLSYAIQATENPTSYGASGLPPGVTLVGNNFSGTPTQAGTYPVTITATNAIGTGTATLNLQVLATAPTPTQEYLALHSFGNGTVANEGSFPGAMIAGADHTLYGVTGQGGSSGAGTVFNLLPSGTAKVLVNFNGSNGANPQGLIQTADGTIYGTTASGGVLNKGTIFKITTSGTLTVLHSFGDLSVANDGANPQAALVLAGDGYLYGTTQNGGSAGQGTVFKMNPVDSTVTILHSFGDGSVAQDGAQPVAALLVDMSNPGYIPNNASPFIFLGTTLRGGTHDAGTLFAMASDGTVAILHSFDNSEGSTDGVSPRSAVAQTGGISGHYILGTTAAGGTLGKGTIFAYGNTLSVTTGTVTASNTLTIVHSFGDGTVAYDGENPVSGLVAGSPQVISQGNNFYGVTQNGGTAGQGTIYNCAISSSNLGPTATVTLLHSFGDSAFPSDGVIPNGGLCAGTDGNLYGTTVGGGDGAGTAYAMVIRQSSFVFGTIPGWTVTGTLPPGMMLDPQTGLLTGTPLPTATAGIYNFTLTDVGFGLSGTRQITFKLDQTFAGWAGLKGISAIPNATSGSDHVPNLMKYFFDIDPSGPMSARDHEAMPKLGSVTQGGDIYLTLTFREFVGATGVTATLQSSSDMHTWSNVPDVDLWSQQIGTDSVTGDPIMQMGARMAPSGSQFLRLNVSMP